MARIINAELERQDMGAGISRMVTRFTVLWSPSFWGGGERTAGIHWNLTIDLMGADSGFNAGDDYLYGLQAGFNSNGQESQEIEERIELATSFLDEDWGRDEVYARIKIVPAVFEGARANTNTIKGNF